MSQKPVIFLAFANDRVDHAAYLRNLPIELDGIRSALQKAVKAGLCELVERSNATIQHILDVFQDEYYKDRIAIFHYGGHANGYQLLLENLDGSHASAHAEGLVSFFAKQQGLQLIFLNGCSSQQQALDLVNAGISAVIGTSQSINDDVATKLAIRFYKGLAAGKAIDRAWLEAIDEVKIQKGTANMRDLFWDGGEEESTPNPQVKTLASDRFPWEIYYKEGAEIIRKWNLPEAVDNPLFGLPEVPNNDLPEAPYRFLERYRREHAEIFFGRSYFIRELFNRATDPNAAPIILFYGQSGVGKSSMLDAGLFPRLEQACNVIYLRRNPEKGLLGTMAEGLGTKIQTYHQQQKQSESAQIQEEIQQLVQLSSAASGEKLEEYQALIASANQQLSKLEAANLDHSKEGKSHKSLATVWKEQEAHFGKPLVVLLDQVEEIYTKPNPKNPHEIEQALAEVHALFSDPQNRPQGKLILSYRKEYHPEIEEAFKNLQLPRERVFLRKLERRDIQEIVMGLMATERLQRRYSLTVEKELDTVIADDLLEDKDSPIAPVLQILLTKMWQLSEQEELRYFSIKKYQQLKRQGILMDDFFHEQMQFIKDHYPELATSGLALDVLHFHTTKLGTANSHSLEELRERYGERQHHIDRLIGEFKNLYLLSDAGQQTTGLAHDTLAPIVQNEFRHSDKPGQRAALILENKAIAFDQNPETVLDIDDLKLVEEGANGMRIWTRKEEELIEKSRKRRAVLLAEKQRNKRLRVIGVSLISLISVIASVFLFYALDQQAEAKEKTKLAEKQTILAKENEEKAIEQTIRATNALDSLTEKEKDLQIALEEARLANDTAEIKRLEAEKQKVIATAARLQAEQERLQAESLVLAGLSKDWLAKGNATKALKLALLAEKKGLQSNEGIKTPVHQALINAYYSGKNSTHKEHFYHKEMRAHAAPISAIHLSPSQNRIVTVAAATSTQKEEVILWNQEGSLISKLSQDIEFTATVDGSYPFGLLHFTPDNDWMIAKSKDAKQAFTIDKQGKTIAEIKFDSFIKGLACIPNSPYFYVHCSANYKKQDTTGVSFWNKTGKRIKQLPGNEMAEQVFYLEFAKQLLIISANKLTFINPKNFEIVRKINVNKRIDYANYHLYDQGKKLLISKIRGFNRIYDLVSGTLKVEAEQLPSLPIAIPNSTRVYSANSIWNMEDTVYKLNEWGSKSLMDYFYTAVSPTTGKIITVLTGGKLELRDKEGNKLKEVALQDLEYKVEFAPDGKQFVLYGNSNTAELRDENLNLIQEFIVNASSINKVSFSPKGDQLITATNKHTAILWDIKPSTDNSISTHQFNNQPETAKELVFSKDGTQFMTYSAYGAIIWDSQSLQQLVKIENPSPKKNADILEYYISKAIFSPDKTRLLLIGESLNHKFTAWLFDRKGELIHQMSFDHLIKDAVFWPEQNKIAIAIDEEYGHKEEYGHIYLYNWDGQQQQHFMEIYDDFNHLTISANGKHLLTHYLDKELVLNVKGELITQLVGHNKNQPTYAPKFSDQNVFLFSNDMVGTIWDANTWTAIGRFEGKQYHDGPQGLKHAISPDGNRILTASWVGKNSPGKAFVLWDGLGNQLATLEDAGTEDYSIGLGFSPDSKYFFCYWNTNINLYTSEGDLIKSWKVKKTIADAKFTANGYNIITSQYDGLIMKLRTVTGIIAEASATSQFELSLSEKMDLGFKISLEEALQAKTPSTKLAMARLLVKQGNSLEAKRIYKQLLQTNKDIELLKNIYSDYNKTQWPINVSKLIELNDQNTLKEFGIFFQNQNRKEALLFFKKMVILDPKLSNVWRLLQAQKQFKVAQSPSDLLPKINIQSKKSLKNYLWEYDHYSSYVQKIKGQEIGPTLLEAKVLQEFGLDFHQRMLQLKDLSEEERKSSLIKLAGFYKKLVGTEPQLNKAANYAEKALVTYKRLKRQYPSSKDHGVLYAIQDLAKMRIAQKQFAAAQSLLTEANKLLPNYSTTRRLQAHLHLHKGELNQAKAIYLDLIDKETYSKGSLKYSISTDLAWYEQHGLSKTNTQLVKDWLK